MGLFEWWFGNRKDPLTWAYLLCIVGIILSPGWFELAVCFVLAIGTAVVRRMFPWERTTVEGKHRASQ